MSLRARLDQLFTPRDTDHRGGDFEGVRTTPPKITTPDAFDCDRYGHVWRTGSDKCFTCGAPFRDAVYPSLPPLPFPTEPPLSKQIVRELQYLNATLGEIASTLTEIRKGQR